VAAVSTPRIWPAGGLQNGGPDIAIGLDRLDVLASIRFRASLRTAHQPRARWLFRANRSRRHGRVRSRLLYDPRPGLPGTRRDARLAISVEPAIQLQAGVPVELELGQGESVALALTDRDSPVPPSRAGELVEDTDRWWRLWSDGIRTGNHYSEVLIRSLINLRLLTYSPTGAPVAAPTTSLPEEIGGIRNWDYRFSWPRDASVAVAAFLAAGKHAEACEFVDWLVQYACRGEASLRVLYDLDGGRSQREREVAGVSGYLGSLPVRLGNLAEEQHQLDV
jgi:hypothetical protein